MYKIYINNTPLYLMKTEEVPSDWVTNTKNLITPYSGKHKHLYNYVDKLEKNSAMEKIVIHSNNLTQLWRDFNEMYHILAAAGGVVFNDREELLMIYRLQTWDLPKGKIEAGELPSEAAVREVQEETGLEEIALGDLLCETYHTYQQKGKRILKHTYWYGMTTQETELTPQTSEDIEKAEWINLALFLTDETIRIYPNILDILLMLTK